MARARAPKKERQTAEQPKADEAIATSGGAAFESCKECPHWQEMRQHLRVSHLLLKAIEGFETRLAAKDFKPTVAEYLKLLQMEQELGGSEEATKEIKVTWVDSVPTSETDK